MLGIPGPGRVAAAAANFYDAAVRGGLADLRRMPAALIDHGRLRSLYRYLPVEQAPPRDVPPAPCCSCRRWPRPRSASTCAAAARSPSTCCWPGRETYIVDYGEIEFSDRTLGLEHWFDEVIPEAIRATSADAGGRPVRLIGWSLGGILALLAHAGDADLPVDAVALIGSPFDFSRVPMVAPLRPIAAVTRGQGITQLYRALGGAPAPLVRGGYQLAGIDKYLMKPWTIASNLDDRDLLAQIEAVDAFMARMHAYPGRTFGQLYHRFFRTNDLAQGSSGADRPHDRPRRRHRAAARGRRARRRDRARRGLPPPRRAGPERRLAASSRPRRAATSACSRAAPRAARRGRCWTGFSTADGYSAPDAPDPRPLPSPSRCCSRPPRAPSRRSP